MFPTKCFVLLALIAETTALFEGDDCVLMHSNLTEVLPSLQAGKCTEMNKCDFAKKLLREHKILPQNCGFNRRFSLVCCPVNFNETMKLFTSKAEKKCFEYYDKRSRPRGVAHGIEALPREFPHMAAIGYGNKKNIFWLCGGSLISESFVLTAAHCINSQTFGRAKWVRLGDLDLKNTTEDASPVDIGINKIFVHRDYKSFSHYNDIALIELKSPVSFDDYVQPACLQTKKDLSLNNLEVIGWGTTEFLGETSNHLMKAKVNVVEYKKCAKKYANVSRRKLKNGIVDDLQICAGDELGRDTCPGDSGGPLHYFNDQNLPDEVLNHFVIVGITSFGKACGFENSCGVYTRVSSYVPWIESIVWPSSE